MNARWVSHRLPRGGVARDVCSNFKRFWAHSFKECGAGGAVQALSKKVRAIMSTIRRRVATSSIKSSCRPLGST